MMKETKENGDGEQ